MSRLVLPPHKPEVWDYQPFVWEGIPPPSMCYPLWDRHSGLLIARSAHDIARNFLGEVAGTGTLGWGDTDGTQGNDPLGPSLSGGGAQTKYIQTDYEPNLSTRPWTLYTRINTITTVNGGEFFGVAAERGVTDHILILNYSSTNDQVEIFLTTSSGNVWSFQGFIPLSEFSYGKPKNVVVSRARSGAVKVWVDGVEKLSSTTTGSLDFTGNPFDIFARNNRGTRGTNPGWKGAMSVIAFWDGYSFTQQDALKLNTDPFGFFRSQHRLILRSPVVGGAALLKIHNETTESTEVKQALVTLARIRSETTELSEGKIPTLTLTRIRSETEEMTESDIAALTLLRQVSESVDVGEELLNVRGMFRQIEELEQVTEVEVHIRGASRIHDETLQISEESLSIKGVFRQVGEAEQISEAVLTLKGLVQQKNESVQMPEQKLVFKGLLRQLNEAEQITEDELRFLALLWVQSEPVQTQEFLVKKSDLLQLVPETVSIPELAIHRGEIVKITVEDFQVSENVFWTTLVLGNTRLVFRAKIPRPEGSSKIGDEL